MPSTAALALIATSAMFPFVMPWNDAAPTFTSLAGLQHIPAGKHGFIEARDGRLYAGPERIRFVGMNFAFSGNLPATRSDAEAIAARLAKFGINCVRLHHLDGRPAPEGILRDDMVTLDPDAMDRLDYFVEQLRRRGIYVLLELHVSRSYPGLPTSSGTPPYHNGIDLFYEPAIALQKRYAKDLLTHVNPYSGKRYADNPAIAFIEINNENSLTMRWWEGRMDNLPSEYLDDLTARWNAWLLGRYGDFTAIVAAWTEAGSGLELVRNGGFTEGLDHWRLLSAPDTVAVAVTGGEGPGSAPTARIATLDGKTDEFRFQFLQEPLALRSDVSYTLQFDARSDVTREFGAHLFHTAHYDRILLKKWNVGSSWKRYSTVFTPSTAGDAVRLSLSNFTPGAGSLWVANVSLKTGGAQGVKSSDRPGKVGVIRRADFPTRTRAVQEDWLRFLDDVETHYWTHMYSYLRETLGAKSLIIGTQQNYSPYYVQANMDVIDMHGYWDVQQRVFQNVYKMNNTPQVGDQHAGVLGPIAGRRIAGKPFIVSEYNYRGANTYATEADLLMLAYASLQDWDGVFIFNYANNNRYNVGHLIGDEGFNGHSNRFAALVPAALMFRRGDIRAAKESLYVPVTRDSLIARMRQLGPAPGTHQLGIDIKHPLVSRVGVRLLGDGQEAGFSPQSLPAKPAAPTVSDTGELSWDPGSDDGKGMFSINAPRIKAIAGFIKGRSFNLGSVIISPGRTVQDWAAISLIGMDATSSATSGNILLTATGNAENADMTFDATRTMYDWGTGPVYVEGVAAKILLPVRPGRVSVWALDETGAARQPVPVNSLNDNALIVIDDRYKTIWYKITVGPP